MVDAVFSVDAFIFACHFHLGAHRTIVVISFKTVIFTPGVARVDAPARRRTGAYDTSTEGMTPSGTIRSRTAAAFFQKQLSTIVAIVNRMHGQR